jgi:threonine aldolase
MAQPKVISITQSTELGTVYTPKEIKELSDFAHSKKMLLHMDGARLCNAAASLNVDLASITTDVGVDVLSFGGTKNGMMFGDAVVFFDRKHSKNFKFIRKQGMHLTSKMRFISAQFEALLSNDLWLKNANHANSMAQFLYKEVKDLTDVKITQKVEVNAVFASLPKKMITELQKKYAFHVFDEQTSEVRWMCSFNTSKKDILEFVNAIKAEIRKK